MKALPPPPVLLRQWLESPHALTAGFFAGAAIVAGIVAWLLLRNLLHTERGLTAPAAFFLALLLAFSGVAGAIRLPAPWALFIGAGLLVAAGVLFFFADHRRFIRNPLGKIVADRCEIVLVFAGFRWTRDKANRHFYFTGDTGTGKTSGMNGLLAALLQRNFRLGGVINANKCDEWFHLQAMAKRYGREKDLIHLRPRLPGEAVNRDHRLNVTGDARLPFTTRARILVDTAASLNPKDEKSFFKTKGASHIARVLELLTDIGRHSTPTNAYELLTSDRSMKAALDKLTELDPSDRRIRLAETLELAPPISLSNDG